MIHLVIKDFYVNRKYILFILLYLGFILYSKSNSVPAMVFGMGIVSYGMLTRSCFNDDKDRGNIFLRTLPIRASTIVLSKYMLGIFILLFATVIFALLALIDGSGMDMYYASIAASSLTMSFTYSIYLPVFFKYGYIQARTFQTAFFIGIMGLSFGFKPLINIAKSAIPIKRGQWFIRPLTNLVSILSKDHEIFLFTAIILSIIMIVISIFLSMKFYCTRPSK